MRQSNRCVARKHDLSQQDCYMVGGCTSKRLNVRLGMKVQSTAVTGQSTQTTFSLSTVLLSAIIKAVYQQQQ